MHICAKNFLQSEYEIGRYREIKMKRAVFASSTVGNDVGETKQPPFALFVSVDWGLFRQSRISPKSKFPRAAGDYVHGNTPRVVDADRVSLCAVLAQ